MNEKSKNPPNPQSKKKNFSGKGFPAQNPRQGGFSPFWQQRGKFGGNKSIQQIGSVCDGETIKMGFYSP